MVSAVFDASLDDVFAVEAVGTDAVQDLARNQRALRPTAGKST